MIGMIRANLALAFHKLGTVKDAKNAPPPDADNRATIAYEYFVADHLCSLATKRKENAKKAAEEAGIIFKPEPGQTVTVYQNETLQIVGQTKQPAEGIDKTALSNELNKLLGAEAAQKVLRKVTKTNSPATTFSFVGRIEEPV